MTAAQDRTQDYLSKLWGKYGCFFAFSNEQFDRSKKEGIEYCHLFSGLICPKQHAKVVMKGMSRITTKGARADVKENGKDAVIIRELHNHEAFYTGDITDTVEALSHYGITAEEVQTVYRRELPNIEF